MYINFAEDSDIDLIAMGTPGKTGLDCLLIGGVAEKIVRSSKVPSWFSGGRVKLKYSVKGNFWEREQRRDFDVGQFVELILLSGVFFTVYLQVPTTENAF